ncbi:SNF2-related protein [Streptomyces sp. NPDC003487]
MDLPEAAGEHSPVSGGYAPGAQVLVRDDLWLVRKCTPTQRDGWMIEVTGVSSFVRGMEAVFYDRLDVVQRLDPRETELVADDSPNHRRSRLFLEAVMRKTSLPQTEHGLALADGFLMDQQVHQLRPAELALSMKNPQPRILIADVVGLGKTLEIGVLLAELIRRGRGERILVVTPQHVLEQFQRELWTRFGIPLVRLDSTGIQRVQQDIPAGRNPFAYFKRVIISVDTLKSDVYAHHLEHIDWDAVVIDESHNLVNRGTKNNALARLLARKTDALILASATPHNGDAASFAELVRMLDEAAIANPSKYEVDDLKHLYIRRTKTTPEVRDSLKETEWADRGPSRPLHVPATTKELAVFKELATRWIPADPDTPSASRHQLVPYRLLKSFLSSHKALLETIKTRIGNLDNPPADKPGNGGKQRTRPEDPAVREAARASERAALVDLRHLAEQIEDSDSAKLTALVDELRDMGVGPGSETRVVVFSESIPTLRWLARTVPAALGFPQRQSPDEKKPWLGFGGAVLVMHREATSDQEQQEIVEKFGLSDDPVRILFTSDVASEGVNLHQQCHHLVHYDLPWSLIRIEQRNGRIDRYGQKHQPEFRALILTSDIPWRTDQTTGQPRTLDDRLVGEKLLAREEQAHRIEGSAEAVTGLYRAKEEENRLTQDLIAGRTVEQSIKQSQQGAAAFLTGILGQVGAVHEHPEVARAEVPRLFASTADYFDEALRQVCRPNPEDMLSLRRDNDGTIAFEPPADLLYRLRALPKSYLDEQQILPRKDEPARMRVTFSKTLAAKRLKAARETTASQWPNVSYVTDVHPVLDWLTDKVLVEIGRHKAPVLAASVATPTYLVQGIYSNALGKPTVVEWMAVSGPPDALHAEPVTPELLDRYGIRPDMPGRAVPRDLPGLGALVPAAIDAAERHLTKVEAEYRQQIEATLKPHRDRVAAWRQEALFASARPNEAELDRTTERRLKLVKSLQTAGEPMLRLLAVLEPTDTLRTAEGGAAQ